MNLDAEMVAEEGINRVYSLWFDESHDIFALPKITTTLDLLNKIFPDTQYSRLHDLWQAYLFSGDAGLWKLTRYRWRLFGELLTEIHAEINKNLSAVSEASK